MNAFNYVFAYVSATLHNGVRRDDERGASMVEYVVLVVLIAALVGVVIALFGGKIKAFVSNANLPSSIN